MKYFERISYYLVKYILREQVQVQKNSGQELYMEDFIYFH